MPGSRRRATTIAAALAVALAFALAASSAPSRPAVPKCSALGAKAAIISAKNLPRRVRLDATGRYPGSGVDTLICRDFTHDGRMDMAATVTTGGTSGVEAWAAFRVVNGNWGLIYHRTGLYKASIKYVMGAGDIIETDPIYKKYDPTCCPTGGFDHQRFHWRVRRFVVVRSWHTANP